MIRVLALSKTQVMVIINAGEDSQMSAAFIGSDLISTIEKVLSKVCDESAGILDVRRVKHLGFSKTSLLGLYAVTTVHLEDVSGKNMVTYYAGTEDIQELMNTIVDRLANA